MKGQIGGLMILVYDWFWWVFNNQFTKESDDQSDDETHHKKRGDHTDVGQHGRHLPSLIIVIFHAKRGVLLHPAIRLNWTSRTTVAPDTFKISTIHFPFVIDFCRTPDLNRFLSYFLCLQQIFSLTKSSSSSPKKKSFGAHFV